MRRFFHCFVVAVLIFAASPAFAHYLWVTIDKGKGEQGVTNIYFEGGPAAGDGHYLDHFPPTGKTWIRTVDNLKPRAIEMTDTTVKEKRWLTAELPAGSPRSVDCYFKFGVYAYGKTNVLLHYYARNLDVAAHEDLHELASAEQMNLDIAPHDHGKQTILTVNWRGEPSAGRKVSVVGPKGLRENLTTNDKGEVAFTVEHEGRYSFKTYIEEEKAGKDGDDEYTLIRHHATMLMQLPLEK